MGLCVLFGLATLSTALSLNMPTRADDMSGAINGFVYDYKGGPLKNAAVLIYSDDSTMNCVFVPDDWYDWDRPVMCGARNPVTGTRGAVSFRVTEEASGPISYAVDLRVTDHSGFFTFLALHPGRYMLVALRRGELGGCLSGIVVVPNALVRAKFHLLPVTKSLSVPSWPCFSSREGSAIYF